MSNLKDSTGKEYNKEINLGMTTYDLNKEAMRTMPAMTKRVLENKLNNLIYDYFKHGKEYFMLLCHEQRDYTIFNLQSVAAYDNAVKNLKECLDNRGEIVSIGEDDYGAISI